MKKFFVILIILFLYNNVSGKEPRVTLKENKSPLARQQAYKEAKRHDFTFLKSEVQLQRFVRNDLLVKLVSEVNYKVASMDLGRPYVRPIVRTFLRQLSWNLVAECGKHLTVTSAVRFTTRQPKNSVPDSVHPTGMAVDLRAPDSKCRKSFEVELLYLEAKGLIQATKERWPVHYHVVVYPEQYSANVAMHARIDKAQYEVREGDNLSTIARRFGTTIRELVTINGLNSPDFLSIGQAIRLR